MQQIVVIPTFGIEEDAAVVEQFEQLFPKQTIITVDGNDLAHEGGLYRKRVGIVCLIYIKGFEQSSINKRKGKRICKEKSN